MADRSELLFSLVGVVGRHLQRLAPGWDGFTVVARFQPGATVVNTWYYVTSDPHGNEVVTAPQTISLFEELRSIVEVAPEPVRVGVLTYVRASGATDLQMLSDRDDLAVFNYEAHLGDRLRPPLAARWQVLRIDQTGLAGTTARLLTPDPTDDAGWPADLPPGTTEVVIADDTPGPLLTVRVHPVADPSAVSFVRFDQLAVRS
jgi:hypothetical protein